MLTPPVSGGVCMVCVSGGFIGKFVGAPVLAVGLFLLRNCTLYVFLSCFMWRGTIITNVSI